MELSKNCPGKKKTFFFISWNLRNRSEHLFPGSFRNTSAENVTALQGRAAMGKSNHQEQKNEKKDLSSTSFACSERRQMEDPQMLSLVGELAVRLFDRMMGVLVYGLV